MRLLGIVILYHPDKSVINNIHTYFPYIDKLVLWDNTPAGCGLKGERVGAKEKVLSVGEGRNVGLGKPLNYAVRYARENGYTHLLTMDQDSCFCEGDVLRYIQAVEKHKDCQDAVFSTNYYLKSQQKAYDTPQKGMDEVEGAMQSGSIFPIRLFEKLGCFREDLFVWGIDTEFCLRARANGIRIYRAKDVLLIHDLGYQKKKRRLMGKEVFPNEYPAERSYYNVRNGFILYGLYPKMVNLWRHLHYHFFKRMVFVILYEDCKTNKINALMGGGKRWVTQAYRGKIA